MMIRVHKKYVNFFNGKFFDGFRPHGSFGQLAEEIITKI